MSTITSEVQICNSALIKLGLDTISSLSENSPRARYCNKQYPILRDEVLFSHLWNFAITRVELGRTANTPAFGFDYEYELPEDVLRVLDVDDNEDGSITYTIEHNPDDGTRVLLTDASTIKIKYIRRVTDVTQFPPTFAEVVAMRLAMDLAIAVKQSTSLAEYFANLYEQYARRARSLDAQEGSITSFITTTWSDARR